MKHLVERPEYAAAVEATPDQSILDTFPTPQGVTEVVLTCTENTSLCPITKQPDYWTAVVVYKPRELCVESKSMKLYLMTYRSTGAFCEQLSSQVAHDLNRRLNCPVTVRIIFNSRGGIIIESTTTVEGQ